LLLLDLGETLVWKEGTMKNKLVLTGFVFAILLLGSLPALAGDAFAGKVTAVRSAEIVVVDYGKGEYIVRIIGVAVPAEGPIAIEAKQFVTKMLLGQVVRARFESRQNGEMLSRLYVGDPGQDVGVELLRNGLATRPQGEDYQFGYKYSELTRAETEARERKRGLWAAAQPK
jgi:endonuclease YncB( thermonuclease family)